MFITATRIGDAVLSTGILEWLRARHPAAALTVACGTVAAPLFAAVPGVDRVLAMPKLPRAGHWLRLWRQSVGTRWTAVVDLRGSATAWTLRAGERFAPKPRRGAVHRVVELQRAFGLADPPAPRLWLPEAAKANAAALWPIERPVLAIAPTANWPGKQWPIDRFVTLAHALTGAGGALAGARVAVFGAPHERGQAAALLAAFGDDGFDGFAVGDLPLVCALIARTRLFVGNDSGLMHCAAALGRPTLGLFGPSDDRRYRPWGAGGRVVRTTEPFDRLIARVEIDPASAPQLMDGLAVDAAIAAAERLVAETGGG